MNAQQRMDLQRRIDLQRRRLQQAQAILVCATWAANHDVEAGYGDVMHVASAMIEDVIAALDSIELARPP